MERVIYAICPGCGKRAQITGHRWDWNEDQDYAQLICECGRSEVPFAEERVLDINLNNPYMRESHFRMLVPECEDKDEIWDRIGRCLAAT